MSLTNFKEVLMDKNPKKKLSPKDYEFMNSLSAAMLEVTPTRLRIVLFFWIGAIFVFIVWAYFTQIDEISRGNGDIIPSGENQMIQNLEGGIVEKIFVNEGDEVKKGQVLVKISNEKSQSNFSTNSIKGNSLDAKIARLKAEASGGEFNPSPELMKTVPELVANERSLFQTNKEQLSSKLSALRDKLEQTKNQLADAKMKKDHLKNSLNMIQEEVKMTEPMVLKGVRSKVDFLKLQREANQISQDYASSTIDIPRLQAAMQEVQNNMNETTYLFRSDAKTKLNEAVSDFRGTNANSTALQDQVDRTLVRAPMKGIVQKLYVHTVGGVIKPGDNIVEVVPSGQALLVEVKIKPADIAFIYYGQKAIVKFTAYDFSIYGGLEGKVVLISPDSIKDDKGNTFYTVRIQTDKNYINHLGKHLRIIPGMTTSVDIITGKKSVLDYILKPILKTKQYMFTER